MNIKKQLSDLNLALRAYASNPEALSTHAETHALLVQIYDLLCEALNTNPVDAYLSSDDDT